MRKRPVSAGGLSKARLRHMHDVMAGYVERGDVPGLVTLVSRRGDGDLCAPERRPEHTGPQGLRRVTP